MREKKEFIVLAFATNEAAMTTEKFCREAKIPGRLIPLPEEVSAGCGIAWRMEVRDWEQHRTVLTGADLSVESVNTVRQWVFQKDGE